MCYIPPIFVIIKQYNKAKLLEILIRTCWLDSNGATNDHATYMGGHKKKVCLTD